MTYGDPVEPSRSNQPLDATAGLAGRAEPPAPCSQPPGRRIQALSREPPDPTSQARREDAGLLCRQWRL